MLLDQVSNDLRLSRGFLDSLVATASHRYSEYYIPKRGSGRRKICQPSRKLKAVQRWLADNVIAKLPIHDAAFAYRPGVGIRANAKEHQGQSYLLRLDMERFFESINRKDIESLLKNSRNRLPNWWRDSDSAPFCKIVCRFGRLTIGAPSSPPLSNVICYQLDTALSKISSEQGVTYTRYADDLFFSTTRANVLSDIEVKVRRVLDDLEWPSDLRLNPSKVRHSSKKHRMRVTGLTLTSQGGISIGRDKKRALSAKVHQLDRLDAEERRSLAGWLAYCAGVEPGFVERLYRKYGAPRVDEAMIHPED